MDKPRGPFGEIIDLFIEAAENLLMIRLVSNFDITRGSKVISTVEELREAMREIDES